jgi:hypothetical protein
LIEHYALAAGDEANIRVDRAVVKEVKEAIAGDFILVKYSEKALAVFGDTKPVKDQLKAIGGRFNPGLTHEGEKKPGWIFSCTKESELRNLLTL